MCMSVFLTMEEAEVQSLDNMAKFHFKNKNRLRLCHLSVHRQREALYAKLSVPGGLWMIFAFSCAHG